MDTAINNPLYGVQIGSIVAADGTFGATVLGPALTKFIAQKSSVEMLTGTSQYVYTDHMNQGSFSCAGSYGLTGVAKVSGALTAYVGNTTASDSKTLSINMSILKWAGVEHVAFNDLNAAELLAGMSSNAKADALGVLDAFSKCQSEKSSGNLQNWVQASNDFYAAHGDGIVVGVLWGGWGTVSLVFTASGTESKWEGGGSASFTYAGEGAAIDIAATYGHSQDTIGKSASTNVNMYANGGCVEAITSGWADEMRQLATKGLDALGKGSVSQSQAMSGALKDSSLPRLLQAETGKEDHGSLLEH